MSMGVEVVYALILVLFGWGLTNLQFKINHKCPELPDGLELQVSFDKPERPRQEASLGMLVVNYRDGATIKKADLSRVPNSKTQFTLSWDDGEASFRSDLASCVAKMESLKII